jgi:hypothetical protein
VWATAFSRDARIQRNRWPSMFQAALAVYARESRDARRPLRAAASIVRDLAAGSGIEFEDRGVRQLKGVPSRGSCSRLDSASGPE